MKVQASRPQELTFLIWGTDNKQNKLENHIARKGHRECRCVHGLGAEAAILIRVVGKTLLGKQKRTLSTDTGAGPAGGPKVRVCQVKGTAETKKPSGYRSW